MNKNNFLYLLLIILVNLNTNSCAIATYYKGLRKQLVEAAIAKDLNKAKLLIASGININISFLLVDYYLDHLIESGWKYINITFSDHKSVIELLIKAKADINAVEQNGYTALMQAAGEGDNEMVQLLLDGGAEVNVADKYGRTAFGHAGKNKDIMLTLIAYGANINAADEHGQTALTLAAATGDDNTLIFLLSLGADVNEGDNTALMQAAHYGHKFIVDLLLSLNADLDKINKFGDNAIERARKPSMYESEDTRKNKVEILKLLKDKVIENREQSIKKIMAQATTLPAEILPIIASYEKGNYEDIIGEPIEKKETIRNNRCTIS